MLTSGLKQGDDKYKNLFVSASSSGQTNLETKDLLCRQMLLTPAEYCPTVPPEEALELALDP